ncbi:MAG: bL17 family ribosomal protein [bacterium]
MNSKHKVPKLGNNRGHRKTVIRNLLNSFVIYEHLTTTKARSKVIVQEFGKLMTTARSENLLLAEKSVAVKLFDKIAIRKVMEVYRKRFADQPTGLINVYRLGPRKGDAAEMVKIVLKGYEYKDVGKTKVTKKKKIVKSKSDMNNINPSINQTNVKNQVDINSTQGKSKSRSGI